MFDCPVIFSIILGFHISKTSPMACTATPKQLEKVLDNNVVFYHDKELVENPSRPTFVKLSINGKTAFAQLSNSSSGIAKESGVRQTFQIFLFVLTF